MTEKKEINDWTQITEQVARLVAQLPAADAACLAMSLAGGEATPELAGLIERLREAAAWRPLLDFYIARNLNLLDELEGSLLERVPCDDEAHDTLKAVVTGLYIGDQSNEFASLVTSFMLFVKLMEVRYSERLRALQDSLQKPDGGGEGGAGGAAAPVVVDEDDRVRM